MDRVLSCLCRPPIVVHRPGLLKGESDGDLGELLHVL